MIGKKRLAQIWSDESGASAVELGLIVLFVAVAAMAAMEVMGGSISGLFEAANEDIQQINTAASDAAQSD